MKNIFSILIIIIITILFNSCEEKLINTETKKLHHFFTEEWEKGLENSPESASWYGDDRFNDRLNDRSLDKIVSDHEKSIKTLKILVQIKRSQLSDVDQLNYDLYKQDLRTSIDGYEFKSYLIPITELGGIHIGLPNMVELMPFNNRTDFQNYINRLQQIPNAVDQTISVMKRGLSLKILPPKVTLEKVPEQINRQTEINIEDSPFYQPFIDMSIIVDSTFQDSMKLLGKSIIKDDIFPAYRNLKLFFEKEYYPNARDNVAISSIPNGTEYYKYLVKYHTTTDKTPTEIHQIGLDEVKRIRIEMDKIIKELSFEGSFSDFLNFLRTSPQFYYDNPDDLIDGYRAICKRVDPELSKFFGKLPRIPYGVKPIPEYQAVTSPTAYYYGPSADGGRPGYFWANTYNLKMRPKYEMAVLAIHEAVPGHHLQIALANE